MAPSTFYVAIFLMLACSISFAHNNNDDDDDGDCTPLPNRVYSWVSNQFRAQYPFLSGDTAYQAIKHNLSYSDNDLTKLRNAALNHYKIYFGLPTETAVYDPVTKRTTIPGYGYVDVLYFDDCYNLQVTSDLVWEVRREAYSLATAEYVYYPTTVVPYGGKYAQLLANFGTPAVPTPGNFIAYGNYNIFNSLGKRKQLQTRVTFAAKYPGIYDLPFRGFEEYFLYEPTWGTGTGTLELITAFTTPQGVLSQFNSLWKFPAANELYRVYGL